MSMPTDDASTGSFDMVELDSPLHDTGGIRPFGQKVSTFVVSAALGAGALGLGGLWITESPVPVPIVVVANESSRLKSGKTAGQRYVGGRLDAMRASSETPSVRDEYPTYPSATVIDTARSLIEVIITESTPTPSVVPGDGGVVELIWHKSGWSLMFSVGDTGAEVWARHQSSGRTDIHGDRPEDYRQFAEILASLSSH
jgi:hypothetical protein